MIIEDYLTIIKVKLLTSPAIQSFVIVKKRIIYRGEQQMTAREKLIQAIQTLPESQIDRVLAYVNQVRADDRPTQEQDSQETPCFDETWWNNLSHFSPEFLEVREQPQFPVREDMFQ